MFFTPPIRRPTPLAAWPAQGRLAILLIALLGLGPQGLNAPILSNVRTQAEEHSETSPGVLEQRESSLRFARDRARAPRLPLMLARGRSEVRVQGAGTTLPASASAVHLIGAGVCLRC